MTLEDEVDERRRDRERFLVAFYDLTKNEPLRWSTHRLVAQAAQIPEDQVMNISQDLAGRGLVELRTLGGIDGYVELTPAGVRDAESIISGSTTQPFLVERPLQLSETEWVELYRPLLRLAFEGFVAEGAWPEIGTLQRALDRQNLGLDVNEAITTLPRFPGEMVPLIPTHFAPRLRLLSHLDEAQSFLGVCAALVRRAVEIYFSDTDDLRLTSDDPSLVFQHNDRTPQIAARLLMGDYPNPFAGGGYGPDGSWSLGINGETARRFRDVDSIDQYFDRQNQLREEAQEQFSAMAGLPVSLAGTASLFGSGDTQRDRVGEPSSTQPKIFVVMPFTEPWSTGVYDFIKRAVRSLGYSDDRVLRADKVTKPGRIDQQILEAITNADVIIGDITGANSNVMWELGFAEAAKVPMVVLNQRIDESPFDLANTRQVPYRLAPTDDDERQLADHIRAALDEAGDTRSSTLWNDA